MKTQRTSQILLGTALCILALGCPVWADGGFIDDFSDGDIEDGSPVMWQWVPELGPIGEQMVTPEGLHLTAEGPKLTTRSWRFARNENGMPVQYAGDVTIRAQMKIPEEEDAQNHSAVFLGLRFDMNEGTGYWVCLNSHFFWIARLGGPGVDATRGYSAWEYNATGKVDFSQDVIIQLDISDVTNDAGLRTTSRLEARFWAAESQMPAQAQLVIHDPHFDVGEVGVASSSMGYDRTVIVRWVEVIGKEVEPIVDFNGNGTVEIKDLVKLIECWGQSEPTVDIVPDGVVNEEDLEVLMNYWQQDVNDRTLLANWKLDETEGMMAHDSTTKNHAVVIGGAQWQPETGQVEGTLALDGIDDFMTTPFILDPSEQIFSVFAWVKGGTPGQVILSQAGGVNWLASNESGCLFTDLKGAGRNAGPSRYSDTIITDDQWHRIGLVWDRSYRSLYVDDRLVATDTAAQDRLASGTGGLYIGADATLTPGAFWHGLVDDVRIYNRVVAP
jgi:hypothetical protein